MVGIADAADFRGRKSLSARQKALTDCRSSQVSGNYMELLKLLFEVRFRRDFGIIWCAHILFTASKKHEFSVTLSLVRGIRKMTHCFFGSIRNAYSQIMEQSFPAACAAGDYFLSLSRLKFN